MAKTSKAHILPESFGIMPFTERQIKRNKKRRRQRSSTLLFFVFILSTGPQLVSCFICRSPPSGAFSRHQSRAFQAVRNNPGSGDKSGDSRQHPSSKRNGRSHKSINKSSESKSRAIDALSQPNSEGENSQSKRSRNSRKSRRKNPRGRYEKPNESQSPKAPLKAKQKQPKPPKKEKKSESLDSLLLPPLSDPSKSAIGKAEDPLQGGLSSWEDFLSVGNERTKESSPNLPKYSKPKSPNNKGRRQEDGKGAEKFLPSDGGVTQELPAISDLFPTGMYTKAKSLKGKDVEIDTSPPSLDGVLPVSDLFYRSSQSMNDDDDFAHEDDELPFSAEQSDQLTTVHNKIKVRRNKAKGGGARSRDKMKRKSYKHRRMVRRGMEMLVGGVPINADPPQRYMDLVYNAKAVNWSETVVTNSRDFGPIFHSSSVAQLSDVERGLFCEHFVKKTMKWDVCPDDLMSIANDHLLNRPDVDDQDLKDGADDSDTAKSSSYNDAREEKADNWVNAERTETSTGNFGTLTSFKNSLGADAKHLDPNGDPRLGGEIVFSIGVSSDDLQTCTPADAPVLERVLAKGIVDAIDLTGFEVSFESLDFKDREDGATRISGSFVLSLEGSESMTPREMEKRAGQINNALALAMDEGDVQLAMAAAAKEESGWPEEIRNRVVEEFLFDDDDGDGPLYQYGEGSDEESDEESEEEGVGEKKAELSSTARAKKESSGPSSLDVTNDIRDTYDGPFGMPGSKTYNADDLFLGGGNDGVFWNYSEENIQGAPYGGQLGLRLVDAVTQRATERQPRVIAIGDVHGCIDELQALLRKCDYRPGDLVVFLGDLVSKGPDSISVVQMAREIGAIGVRGNHDFEVVRWHQAIKSGVDPPVVGSEHFHIASCLSNADMKWMYSLPWYISSKELSTLFVHAGFVSGIRLGKQNPRLMMNMRSILPDGTVTSKFFNNWPWARLWDGPQTVLFGHDADRGLQQYEHAVGLDTGCVYGGRLTACILPEKRLVSVSAKREYFKYRRKHYD
ncbi:unnamed protein product [Cylindrotheca closterium]|uniref:Calcineurin-like phosphoesterase domain-containing protein n=1 Tax=Cylindrotheca closterium TaxID=2856 RepID=A0AAD2CAL0_9STRA|nr:unnamed protein product [Cylindrotheca closterium]